MCWCSFTPSTERNPDTRTVRHRAGVVYPMTYAKDYTEAAIQWIAFCGPPQPDPGCRAEKACRFGIAAFFPQSEVLDLIVENNVPEVPAAITVILNMKQLVQVGDEVDNEV